MEFKGTKGKWKVNSYDETLIVPDELYTNDGIARVFSREFTNNKVESKANAQLIAHAPQMLEMLQTLIEMDSIQHITLHNQVKQLIQSATATKKTMTKEEKIKEAWGLFWDRLNETQKQIALENNGYASIGYTPEQSKFHRDLRKSKTFDVDDMTRPKSLRGIETNNNWIKIESELDLPEKDVNCYFICKYDNRPLIGCYLLNNKEFFSEQYYELSEITHFQPITKPKPPIY